MNSHLIPEMSDNCVAYRDVGEGREQEAVSFEVLANSLLLAANSALFSNISGIICFVQNQSELPLEPRLLLTEVY